MATTDYIGPVVDALAEVGVTLIEEHKAELEKLIEPMVDSDADQVMNALADHIDLHGLAGAIQNPLRNAITGSEETVTGIINNHVEGGFDALEAWLKKVADANPAPEGHVG